MSVRVGEDDFDAGAELAAIARGDNGAGAVASFIGRVRGGEVTAMTLEHYPGMTEAALSNIEAEARRRWPLRDLRIIHRIGRLLPGAQIVFVAAASESRAASFEACAFVMDYLKTSAPFWKKEETAEGAAWVEARSSDEAAAKAWKR